jgi:hypothetical protein
MEETIFQGDVKMLPEGLVLIISVVLLPVLAQLFKWGMDKFGWEIHSRPIKWIIYGLSIGIALLWLRPILPAFEDPAVFVPVLFTVAKGVQEFAQLVYDKLYSGLFEKVGFAPEFQIAGNHGGEVS